MHFDRPCCFVQGLQLRLNRADPGRDILLLLPDSGQRLIIQHELVDPQAAVFRFIDLRILFNLFQLYPAFQQVVINLLHLRVLFPVLPDFLKGRYRIVLEHALLDEAVDVALRIECHHLRNL